MLFNILDYRYKILRERALLWGYFTDRLPCSLSEYKDSEFLIFGRSIVYNKHYNPHIRWNIIEINRYNKLELQELVELNRLLYMVFKNHIDVLINDIIEKYNCNPAIINI